MPTRTGDAAKPPAEGTFTAPTPTPDGAKTTLHNNENGSVATPKT